MTHAPTMLLVQSVYNLMQIFGSSILWDWYCWCQHRPACLQMPSLSPACTLPQLLQLSSQWQASTAIPSADLAQQIFECPDVVQLSAGIVLVRAAVGHSKGCNKAVYLGSLQPGDVQQLIWQGPRCVLRRAVLRIPADAQLVISGNGNDLTLQYIAISGAFPTATSWRLLCDGIVCVVFQVAWQKAPDNKAVKSNSVACSRPSAPTPSRQLQGAAHYSTCNHSGGL